MNDLEWSQHAKDVARERQISEGWVLSAIQHPDRSEARNDGLWHYIKSIPEHGGRFLRVVVNRNVSPNRVVTVFFDRRVGRSKDL